MINKHAFVVSRNERIIIEVEEAGEVVIEERVKRIVKKAAILSTHKTGVQYAATYLLLLHSLIDF